MLIRKETLLRCTALSSCLVAVAIGTAAPAMAQPATTTTAAADDDAGAIIVTGSRIARRDLETAAPLSVVSAEEFKLTGTVNVEQVLNALPQVVPATTAFSNNPGGGVATLDLRGLGSTRNLVLVNGRRYMFYDTSQRVDLNTIPQFLVDSVDVVTGGASAVYGSDAIAGVVNFRLRNIKGFEIGGQQSITERGDGQRYDIHAALGGEFADGKGHVSVYGSYFNRQAVYQGYRDFSDRTLQESGLRGGGNTTTPLGRFSVPNTAAIAAGNGLPAITLNRGLGTNFSGLGATFDSATSSSRPFVSGVAAQGGDGFDYAPLNYLQVPQERWLLGAYGDYEIADGISAYMEVSYVNNRVANELAPTPVTGNFNVNLATVAPFLSTADNAALAQIDANETAINAARAARGQAPLFAGTSAPANAAGVIQLSVARRMNDLGGRNSLDDRNAFRALLGFRGDIGNTGLTFDAYYSYARTRNANVQSGNISRRAFQAGLDGTGTAIDIFGPATLNAAMRNAISITAQNNDISELQVAQASVSGKAFNFGLGADDVGFAIGGEYRRLSSQFIPDTALASGDVVGFNANSPTKGGYDVVEAFGELRVPVIADRPFFNRLELSGAVRYSDYSLKAVGGVVTYAGGVEWAPIPDVTFRGQYSRAIRAPNVGELFGGGGQNFPTATDPCTTAAALAAGPLRNTCIATGVPAANLGQGVGSVLQPNTQLQARTGGNPNLNAEKATTYTFGAVIKPRFIPGLNITADYYNIEIGNAIFAAGGGAANILDLCYNQFQDANNGFCRLITRNSSTGAIDGSTNPDGSQAVIFTGGANLSTLRTSGVDIGVDYTTRLGFGLASEESRLNFSFLATWTESNLLVPVNGVSGGDIECAGYFGVNCTPQSDFKFVSRVSWADGPVTTSVRWRYLSSVRDDDVSTDYLVERLAAYSLFDLTLSVDVTDRLRVTAGVNNLLDKQPQLVGAGNQEAANTYPGVYDVLGRDFFLSANIRF